MSTLRAASLLVLVSFVVSFFASRKIKEWGLEDGSPPPPPSSSSAAADGSALLRVVGAVVSSPADERTYEWVRLDANGLEVLLISDPSATKAAAAVDVRVGSLSDPSPWAGLAHAVEHFLFLGTERFRAEGENGFNTYLNAHGGMSNAYTDSEDTNYYFEVDSGALEGTLDRFAQFFVAPLFNASSVTREVLAVDSEHRKNLQSDGWRSYQLLKETSSPASPFRSFSTGNKETLGKPTIRAAAAAFHGLHYGADRMRACILGRESIASLRALAVTYLGDVPPAPPLEGASGPGGSGPASASASASTSGLPFQTVDPADLSVAVEQVRAAAARLAAGGLDPDVVFPPAPEGAFRGRLIAYKPVQESNELDLMFPLWPMQSPDMRRVPGAGFLTSLLGDESTGGLLPLLRSRGLAEGVSAGLELDTSGFALLQLSVSLSPLAMLNITAAGEAAAAALPSGTAADAIAAARALASSQSLAALVDAVLEATYSYLDLVDAALTASVAFGMDALRAQGLTATALGVFPEEVAGPLVRAGRRPDSGPTTRPGAAVRGMPPLLTTAQGGGAAVDWPASPSDPAHLLWLEQLAMSAVGFRFPVHGEAASAVSSFARALHRSTPSLILGAPDAAVWQPAHALRIVRALVPEAVVAFLSSSLLPLAPLLALDSIEPVYSSRYSAVSLTALKGLSDPNSPFAIPAAVLAASLALPRANPYVPTDLSVRSYTGAEQAARLGLPASPPPLSRLGDPARNKSAAALWREYRVDPFVVVVEEEVGPLFARSLLNEAAAAVAAAEASSASPPRTVLPDDARVAPAVLVWASPDTFFGWPRTSVTAELLSLRARDSPSASLLTSLFTGASADAANEELYQVAKAGADVSVDPGSVAPGLVIDADGYTPTVAAILDSLLPRLLAPGAALQADRVAARLSLVVESLRNAAFDQPYRRAAATYGRMVGSVRWTEEQLLAAADELAGVAAGTAASREADFSVSDPAALLARVRAHATAVLASVRAVQLLVSGNESPSSAKALALAATAKVFAAVAAARIAASGIADDAGSGPAQVAPFPRVLGLPLGSYVREETSTNAEDPNSAVYAVYQLGLRVRCSVELPSAPGFPARAPPSQAEEEDVDGIVGGWTCARRAAAFDALSSLVHEPAFDELRTKQQLGYIVSAGGKVGGTAVGESVATWAAATTSSASSALGASCGGSGQGVCADAKAVAVASDGRASLAPSPAGDGVALLPSIGDSVLALVVLVQGTAQPAFRQDERAATFMADGLARFLADLPVGQFESAVAALRTQRARPPAAPSDVHAWAWGEIASRSYRFGRGADADDDALAALTLDDVRALHGHVVGHARRRLAVEMVAAGAERGTPDGEARAVMV
jgi:secreted Zn-dependent insulinase-like peptidase